MTRITKTITLFVALILTAGMVVPSANATLIGDTVKFEALIDGSIINGVSSFDIVVEEGAGDVVLFIADTFSINVEAASFTIEVTGAATNIAPNVEFVLSGLDWVGSPAGILTGATISNQTGFFSTLSGGSISFDAHSVTIDINPLSQSGAERNLGAVLTIALQTEHPATTVPEPGTLALFGFGLIGLGVARRKKQ